MPAQHRVAVLGGGSFGTVIANIIAANQHAVTLWMRCDERAEILNESQENPTYLPGYKLDPGLKATTDLPEAVTGADTVFVAVPSKSFRDVTRELAACLDPAAMVVSTTKGIEADGFRLMSQVLAEELPHNPIGVLSGPNLAREIAAGQISGTVIASSDQALNETIQSMLHSGSFRVYSSTDMYGVELGGALKNVYAIMAGLAAALEVGENTIGMLLTRSLAEMSRFAVSMGADPLTFLGLAGVGDLIVTCSSPLSRNYRVGFALGKGKAMDEILADLGQVAEGVNTLKLLKAEADRREIYMPLVSGLYAILYERKTLDEVIGGMMMAEQPQDVEFSLGA
ncbi:MAG: NAD(P)H-dependent glycerol-3-phosphate dehydrogenase, partial [Planctomycetota bacterium]